MKHRIGFGLYTTYGSINCQLAEKTGFTDADAEVMKEALRTLFENDVSSARPEGSMEVLRLYWWKHNCKNGSILLQRSTASSRWRKGRGPAPHRGLRHKLRRTARPGG